MEKHRVKFGCLCLQAHPFESPTGNVDLGNGYFLESPWAKVDVDDWAEELGKWQVEEIRDANIWV
jgi:hypothetical protein